MATYTITINERTAEGKAFAAYILSRGASAIGKSKTLGDVTVAQNSEEVAFSKMFKSSLNDLKRLKNGEIKGQPAIKL